MYIFLFIKFKYRFKEKIKSEMFENWPKRLNTRAELTGAIHFDLKRMVI